MKNKKGFTIVELVIVIAVIAILAAVLIPTFTTVTANARASAALSQAKNAQSAVLGNTEGIMPENTLFAINSTGDAKFDYAFVIKNRKIEQVKNDSIKTVAAEGAYPVVGTATIGGEESYSANVYTVFVTADRFDDTKGTSELISKVDTLVASVVAKREGVELSATPWTTVDENVLPAELKGHNGAAGGSNYKPLAGSDFAVWAFKVSETKNAYVKVYYNGDIADTCVCFLAA